MQGNMKFSFLFAMIQETIVLLETKNITFDMETTIEFMIYIFIDVFFFRIIIIHNLKYQITE